MVVNLNQTMVNWRMRFTQSLLKVVDDQSGVELRVELAMQGFLLANVEMTFVCKFKTNEHYTC